MGWELRSGSRPCFFLNEASGMPFRVKIGGIALGHLLFSSEAFQLRDMESRMNWHDWMHTPRDLGMANSTASQMVPFLQNQGMRGCRVHRGNFSFYDLFGNRILTVCRMACQKTSICVGPKPEFELRMASQRRPPPAPQQSGAATSRGGATCVATRNEFRWRFVRPRKLQSNFQMPRFSCKAGRVGRLSPPALLRHARLSA
jgi:hypothetical protein